MNIASAPTISMPSESYYDLSDAVRKIRGYSEDDILRILSSAAQSADAPFCNLWANLTLDLYCNSDYCRIFGVDYVNLPREGRNRLKVFALYLAERR